MGMDFAGVASFSAADFDGVPSFTKDAMGRSVAFWAISRLESMVVSSRRGAGEPGPYGIMWMSGVRVGEMPEGVGPDARAPVPVARSICVTSCPLCAGQGSLYR